MALDSIGTGFLAVTLQQLVTPLHASKAMPRHSKIWHGVALRGMAGVVGRTRPYYAKPRHARLLNILRIVSKHYT